MNLQLIREYIGNRPGGLRQLAEDAGMSEANLHRCIRINKIQAADLEKVAKCLRVKIGLFFDNDFTDEATYRPPTESGYKCTIDPSTAVLLERIKSAQEIIVMKDDIIADKDRLIDRLLDHINPVSQ